MLPFWLYSDLMTLSRKPKSEPEQAMAAPPRRVVCAVHAQDTGVLRAAAEMTKQWDAQLYVVHVVPEVHEGLIAQGFHSQEPLSEPNAVRLLEEMKSQAGSHEKPVQAEVVVRTGDWSTTVKRVARSLQADLVITGNQNQSKHSRVRRQVLSWNWVLLILGFDPASAGW